MSVCHACCRRRRLGCAAALLPCLCFGRRRLFFLTIHTHTLTHTHDTRGGRTAAVRARAFWDDEIRGELHVFFPHRIDDDGDLATVWRSPLKPALRRRSDQQQPPTRGALLCKTAHTLNSSQSAQHFAGSRSLGVATLSCQREPQLRYHPRQHHARPLPSPSLSPQITGRARPSAGGRRAPGACGSSRLLRAGSRTASAAAPSRRRRLRRPSRGAVVPRPPY